MFVCLSSGSQPRYRQDIIRSIGMPAGSHLQFRYSLDLVAQGVKAKITDQTAVGEDCLICYVDQSQMNVPPQLVPCRFAKIASVKQTGDIVIVVLSLKGLAYTENLAVANNDLSTLTSGILPKWNSASSSQYPEGAYWLKIPNKPESIVETSDEKDWQSIVHQLVFQDINGQKIPRTDFTNDPVFYSFRGIRPIVESSSDISAELPIKNSCELRGGQKYEIQIYHYNPHGKTPNIRLSLGGDDSLLKFIDNQVVVLDSPYDLTRIRFKTGFPAKTEATTLKIIIDDSNQIVSNSGFNLPIEIKGAAWQLWVMGAFLGLILAAPQFIAAISNSATQNKEFVLGSIIFFNIIGGIFAALNLKKSI